jgi:hypothetical protein
MTLARGNSCRQVMIGDQHIDTGGTRCGDASDAGNAIVDRHDQTRPTLQRQRHDFRGQPVAEFEAVGHQEIHGGEAPAAQRAHQQRSAGCAIGVEVTDDQHGRPRSRCWHSNSAAAFTASNVPTGNS